MKFFLVNIDQSLCDDVRRISILEISEKVPCFFSDGFWAVALSHISLTARTNPASDAGSSFLMEKAGITTNRDASTYFPSGNGRNKDFAIVVFPLPEPQNQ